MRVIPGSFGHMLHEVKASESNPPLYYVLAWGWARAFGRDEWGIRSLSALLGTLTVALGYPIGKQLASRRVGLILAGFLAFNPMLIWYSQEARSYALLILFAALSFLFFLRAFDSGGRPRELAFWAVTSALAIGSHYFAFFAVGIEAAVARRRPAPPLEGPAAGLRGHRRHGRHPDPADHRPDQPGPHRLDRPQPGREPLLRDRRRLPDRRDRLRDRRAAGGSTTRSCR